ncbi:UTRA domain-containing protein, partial [Streptococcus suis]
VSLVRTFYGERLEYDFYYFLLRVVPYIIKEIAESSIYRYLEEVLHLTISHSIGEISLRFANEDEKHLIDLVVYDMVV